VARAASPRLLVLGGSGFLGSQVVLRAASMGLEVAAACRHPERAPEAARRAARWLELDASQPGAAARLLARERPGAVIVAAALARGADCERAPELATRLNAELPAEVAEACAEQSARLLHVSTDLVFGGEPPRPAGFREEDEARPLHVYGRSKLEGEGRVLTAQPAALVVRLPLLYGDSLGRGLGASDSLLAALDAVDGGGERPALLVDELRTPLDVEQASRALLELAAGEASGLLHVAGPESLSRFELGRAILEGRGRSAEASSRLQAVERAELPLVPPRPRDVSLDAGRARERLSFRLLAPRERFASRPRSPGG